MKTSKSLKDILKEYRTVYYEAGAKDKGDLPYFNEQTEQAIVEAVEGLIIGQDETNQGDVSYDDDLGELANACRNKLRAEQRKAIKEWQ